MLSAELTPSAALLNTTYQDSSTGSATGIEEQHTLNGVTKDKFCLQHLEATSTTHEKQNSTTSGAALGTGKAASQQMTKQLTTTTATNAASSITQTPAVISLSPTGATTGATTGAPTTPTNTATASATAAATATAAANVPEGRAATENSSIAKPSTVLSLAAAAAAVGRTSRTSSGSDASGRSAALERAYVHDVYDYEHCVEPAGPVRPRVAQFLSNLDPGSVVCDVGCGSGRYLTQCNPAICTIGVDRCYRLGKVAHEKGGEVALCDNLELPFRDECFDAVLSIAVVHHFATTERRVRALRELARILRIGGRVVISVWALEQRHRRFESQDVLIPWQPPKNRNFSYSDEEDDDDFLPPYHAYTEDSNSSRSAGDGDSSSLSSSSPGESCYSFVRRAIQKLAGGRRHAWFLDSWTSKDTKNDSSLDEDAKDLPIELRRLEDFDDFPEPPLSAGLKSRSLGSILQPPPRQIVRSRSSVPSLGGPLVGSPYGSDMKTITSHLLNAPEAALNAHSHSSTPISGSAGTSRSISAGNTLIRRPKLIKQKQSLCDENYHLQMQQTSQLPGQQEGQEGQEGQPAQATFLRKQSSLNEELMACNRLREKDHVRKRIQKQTSLNEAFLCRSAMFSKRLQIIREGFTAKIKNSTGSLERVTKTGLKIIHNLKPGADAHQADGQPPSGQQQQQQHTMQSNNNNKAGGIGIGTMPQQQMPQHAHPHHSQTHQHLHHHHHHHSVNPQNSAGSASLFPTHLMLLHKPATGTTSTVAVSAVGAAVGSSTSTSGATLSGPVTYCSGDCSGPTVCHCSAYQQECIVCATNPDSEAKARRHSRESGSDSSKDSSLQSDTSIESEDSFASVIFIPKPKQQQQQLNYQQQHHNSHSNSSSSNSTSSSSNGANANANVHPNYNHAVIGGTITASVTASAGASLPVAGAGGRSVPTSPLIMPCPPTPAHSPAAIQTAVTSPPQTMAAVTAAMAILAPPCKPARFNFDEAHIKQQTQHTQHQTQPPLKPLSRQTVLYPGSQKENSNQTLPVLGVNESQMVQQQPRPKETKITRQTIKDLPPIPKFRKQQSLQLQRPNFPIVRRASGTSCHKLLSLELFNPATDDLDSDCSEPSSPDSIDSVISAPKSASAAADMEAENEATLAQLIKSNQQQYHKGELQINNATPNDIILNADSAPLLPSAAQREAAQAPAPQHCVDFAEQLSAQLQRELEDKTNRAECRSLDGIGDLSEYLDEQQQRSGKKRERLNGDLTTLRDELRERRLMLANLSTQASLQQSPSSSTSSLSFTIHEEEDEENERSYTLGLYEQCKISKFNYKRNRPYNLSPETAYLLQEDDSDVPCEDDVIPEEDEEADAEALEARGGDQLGEGMHDQRRRAIKAANEAATAKQQQLQQMQQQQMTRGNSSGDSWEHSNSSTTSLDSPSQGGATTHHRYYHVFREGELDALINHHVASLHIVSSYYERASWCVVAEKVQVWTI